MFRKLLIFLALSGTLIGNELQDDIDQATSILQDFRSAEDEIPSEIIKNAKGLVILNLIKGAFFFRGREGQGLVVARTQNGWSAPSAIAVGGSGKGFQIGGEPTECIFVLNTKKALDAFIKGGTVTLGIDLNIATGPMESSEASSVAVYTYSKSQGLFAGVPFDGTPLTEQKNANAVFYKMPVSTAEILSGNIPPPPSAKALYHELNGYLQ